MNELPDNPEEIAATVFRYGVYPEPPSELNRLTCRLLRENERLLSAVGIHAAASRRGAFNDALEVYRELSLHVRRLIVLNQLTADQETNYLRQAVNTCLSVIEAADLLDVECPDRVLASLNDGIRGLVEQR